MAQRRTTPSAVYVIVDNPSARPVSGTEPATLTAFRLDVGDGSPDDAVSAFVNARQFPSGTQFGVVDESDVTALLLSPTLEPGELKPGQQTS